MNTRQSAIAVLAAIGLTAEDIASLPRHAVAADHSHVRTTDGSHDVPAPARPLLQAQTIARHYGADPSDPLYLANSPNRQTIDSRAVSQHIAAVNKHCGIALRARYARWGASPAQWRQRSGVSIQAVHP